MKRSLGRCPQRLENLAYKRRSRSTVRCADQRFVHVELTKKSEKLHEFKMGREHCAQWLQPLGRRLEPMGWAGQYSWAWISPTTGQAFFGWPIKAQARRPLTMPLSTTLNELVLD
jgi:hypothetical protein